MPWVWMVAALYLLALSLAAFLLFAWDKHCAVVGRWRIPERTLLMVALAGGTPGAIAGQRLLRHKTRKEPFRSRLLWIAIGQTTLVLALCALVMLCALASTSAHGRVAPGAGSIACPTGDGRINLRPTARPRSCHDRPDRYAVAGPRSHSRFRQPGHPADRPPGA